MIQNKHKKKLAFIVISTIIITTIVLTLKNQFLKERDIRTLQTERKMTSKELSRTADQSLTDSTLIEKAVEVEGVLKEVTFKHDRYSLILEGDYKDKLIICELKIDQSDKVKDLKKGNTVTIKGILKGHLKDAILLQCIIIDRGI